MGKIFYIMGKSATGKDSIFSRLKKNKKLNLNTVILYTTRPIRENEVNGVDYHFIKEEAVQCLEKTYHIIEQRAYQTVHGIWRYITVDDEQFDLENKNYLIIGTLESYQKLQHYFGKEKLLPIYIAVEDGIRLQRAIDREKQQKVPKYSELCRRYLADEKDFSPEHLRQAGISKTFCNDSLERCLNEIEEYIRNMAK